MYRMFRNLPRVATACVLAATLAACNGSPSAPSAPPSAAAGGASDAGPNGETLKVQAPSLVAPENDLRLDTRKPTLVANNVAGKFVGGSYSYEFELLNDGNTRIDGRTLNSGSGTTTWAYPTDLERDTPYRWRVRARLGNTVGPWSETRRFLTLFEKRTPDPAPGTRLPLPNMVHILHQWPRKTPASCQSSARARKRSGEAITFAGGSSSTRSLTPCGSRTRAGATTGSAATLETRRSTSSCYNYTRGSDEGNAERVGI